MTKGGGEFLDTNVLVYAFSSDPRSIAAQALLSRRCQTGVQSLNEFANVMRRKFALPWPRIHSALADIRAACVEIQPMDLATHTEALRIAQRHGYSIFDSLLIAAALTAGCSTFWSEDMGDGVVIDGKLRIADPFKA